MSATEAGFPLPPPPTTPAGKTSGSGGPDEFKPPKPKFGGIRKVDSKSYGVWVGGEPKADFSGLKDPDPPTTSATQFRSTSISAQQKAQFYRTTGLDDKFSRSKNLLVFQQKIWKHMKEFGLDTIAYMVDPADSTNVVTVVSDHGRFTYKEGSDKARELQKNHYDEYDRANSDDAVKFLLNSIDEDLQKQLYQGCSDDDPFIVYWLRLIKIINVATSEHYEAMEDKLKSRKISKYEGENVELICTDYLDDWEQLSDANMWIRAHNA